MVIIFNLRSTSSPVINSHLIPHSQHSPSTPHLWNTYSSSSQYFLFLLLWLGSHTNKLIRTFQQSVTKWWLFSVTKWSLLLLVVQYKGVLGGGKRTNNQMILMTYPSWWFNKWSGWRDLNSHSTLDSQT